jgi:hypothetical protein
VFVPGSQVAFEEVFAETDAVILPVPVYSFVAASGRSIKKK